MALKVMCSLIRYCFCLVILSSLQAAWELKTWVRGVEVCVGICFLCVSEVSNAYTKNLFNQCLIEYECKMYLEVPSLSCGVCSFLLSLVDWSLLLMLKSDVDMRGKRYVHLFLKLWQCRIQLLWGSCFWSELLLGTDLGRHWSCSSVQFINNLSLQREFVFQAGDWAGVVVLLACLVQCFVLHSGK